VPAEPFDLQSPDGPAVHGALHRPERRIAPAAEGLVLTHGAGSNHRAPLLAALAERLSADGLVVLRCDLPFRQMRGTGPPSPAGAAIDREGLRRAVLALRPLGLRRVFLGGHSYGGRQASMLAADAPELADALLLLSYPLHPPGRSSPLRTEHFPRLRTPILFVHGTTDAFASIEEVEEARALIPGRSALTVIERAGHDLLHVRRPGPRAAEAIERIARDFLAFVAIA
jgi:uncharacterized protein